MYYGKDDRYATMLEGIFKNINDETNAGHFLTRISDSHKLEESLIGVAFDIILIEQGFLDGSPLEWITNFKKKYPRVKSPLILVGEESDPVKLLRLLDFGYMDYFGHPPDKLLLIEKFGLYTTGKRSSDLRQVYSQQMSQQADIAQPGIIEELSEFDCKIRSNQNSEIGKMQLLYSRAFSVDGKVNGQVVARCYECTQHPDFKEQFLAKFYFVAITNEVLTNIRNSLRKTYVAGKTKG